jgi:hypothetical protein
MKSDAIEMRGDTLVKCVKATHVVDGDYAVAVGIGFDLWNNGYVTKAGTYLWWLAKDAGYSALNPALGSVINNLRSVLKVNSNSVNEFVVFVKDLGFSVEDDMMGIVG